MKELWIQYTKHAMAKILLDFLRPKYTVLYKKTHTGIVHLYHSNSREESLHQCSLPYEASRDRAGQPTPGLPTALLLRQAI